MLYALSSSMKVIPFTINEQTNFSKKSKHFDLQVKVNNCKINHLILQVKDSCNVNEPFESQYECQDIFYKIQSKTDENRNIINLKRELHLEYGLEWDEEFVL
jgi:hypothetical protein